MRSLLISDKSWRVTTGGTWVELLEEELLDEEDEPLVDELPDVALVYPLVELVMLVNAVELVDVDALVCEDSLPDVV